MTLPRRVIKLGGSLLDDDRLPSSFSRWLAVQTPAANVLIVGGGDLADAIRALDRRFGLDGATAHWLCIRAMGITARFAQALWPEFRLVTEWDQLRADIAAQSTHIAFDVEYFLRREEPTLAGVPLEHSWSVTSDSIAARVADALAADELVLLKSTLPAAELLSCAAAAQQGYVDRFFPQAAASLARIRAVDLRSAEFREAALTAPA